MAGRLGRRIYRTRSWAHARRLALVAARYRCQRCGRAGVLEVHHRRPLADGGEAYALRNLEAVCRRCHQVAHHPIPPDRQAWLDFVQEAGA